jgi:hypothetical protein
MQSRAAYYQLLPTILSTKGKEYSPARPVLNHMSLPMLHCSLPMLHLVLSNSYSRLSTGIYGWSAETKCPGCRFAIEFAHRSRG